MFSIAFLCLIYGIFLEFILIALQSPGALMQACELEYYTLSDRLYVFKKKQNALELKYILTLCLCSLEKNELFFKLSISLPPKQMPGKYRWVWIRPLAFIIYSIKARWFVSLVFDFLSCIMKVITHKLLGSLKEMQYIEFLMCSQAWHGVFVLIRILPKMETNEMCVKLAHIESGESKICIWTG